MCVKIQQPWNLLSEAIKYKDDFNFWVSRLGPMTPTPVWLYIKEKSEVKGDDRWKETWHQLEFNRFTAGGENGNYSLCFKVFWCVSSSKHQHENRGRNWLLPGYWFQFSYSQSHLWYLNGMKLCRPTCFFSPQEATVKLFHTVSTL